MKQTTKRTRGEAPPPSASIAPPYAKEASVSLATSPQPPHAPLTDELITPCASVLAVQSCNKTRVLLYHGVQGIFRALLDLSSAGSEKKMQETVGGERCVESQSV